MAMAMVALRVVRSTLPLAGYLDMARLTTRGLVRSRLPGRRLGRPSRPISPARSVTMPDRTPAARMTGSRAAFRATVKLARSGSVPGTVPAASAMAVRSTLVGDQQGVDLLVDAAGGAGAQDPAAEDGGLELEVGALDLPALAVECGDLAGGVAVRVEEG